MHPFTVLTVAAYALSSVSALSLDKRELNDKQKSILKAHNDARSEANNKDKWNRKMLEWDSGLERSASKWAEELVKNEQNGAITLNHAKDRSGQGENLSGSNGQDPFDSAAKGWIDNERPKYECGVHIETYIKNEKFGEIGHYTQVIWPNTTKVGVAIATHEKSKNVYVVARYSPPGNFQDKAACGKP